jgi:hypothetical protein
MAEEVSLAARLTERWDRFWYAEGNPLSLGVFRALFALCLAFELPITKSRSMFAVEGGFHLPYFPFPSPVSLETFRALHVLQYPFILLLGLGVVPRVAAGVLLVLQGYVFFADQLNFRNHPYLFLLILGLLAFAPSGRAFSIPALLRRLFDRTRGGPAPAATAPLTIQRLIQAQISIVYFYAALHKLSAPFLSGRVLATVMSESITGGRVGRLLGGLLSPGALESFRATASQPEFWVPIAWTTVILELLLGFALWIPKIRPAAMVFGIAFHLAIGYTMKIDLFSAMMIASYVLFLDPETLPRLLDRRSAAPVRAAPAVAPARASPATAGRPKGSRRRRR